MTHFDRFSLKNWSLPKKSHFENEPLRRITSKMSHLEKQVILENGPLRQVQFEIRSLPKNVTSENESLRNDNLKKGGFDFYGLRRWVFEVIWLAHSRSDLFMTAYFYNFLTFCEKIIDRNTVAFFKNKTTVSFSFNIHGSLFQKSSHPKLQQINSRRFFSTLGFPSNIARTWNT